ncbi:tRNA dihydrouridine synthase DusB [Candidatus Woesearchaeota archaeon]|nr:tRNA dihydrouridine synthase DusB [Candidatus Woesearchaeota archaeon]
MKFPKLESKTILAPMAGINDLAFRLLCKDLGCGMTYSEMISAPALARKNKATIKLIDVVPEEHPFGLQLFGQKTEEIVKAAQYLEEHYKPDVIDFNLGCPARQIIRQGAGSSLLIRKNRVVEIVKACSSSLSTPFTVKIRSAFEGKKIVAIDIAKACEEAGAAAIAVHPRTMSQGYSGKADWSIIKQVKETVNIPVIGNGDVFSPPDALRLMEETGCDYVMIGRAAMKNPLIFRQVNDYLRKKSFKQADDEAKLKMIKTYLFLAKKHEVGFVRTKLHCQLFTTGMKGGAALRHSLGKAKDEDEIRRILGT